MVNVVAAAVVVDSGSVVVVAVVGVGVDFVAKVAILAVVGTVVVAMAMMVATVVGRVTMTERTQWVRTAGVR